MDLFMKQAKDVDIIITTVPASYVPWLAALGYLY